MGYIGGQKKGHFRRFCEVLPIFFEKNRVGGDDGFDWNVFNKKNKKNFMEHRISRVRPRSASLAHATSLNTQ